MQLVHTTVDCKFDLLSTTAQDTPLGKGFEFSGHGAAWARDLAGNELQKGAFKTSIAERVPNRMVKIRWMHDAPMGFVTDAKEDDIGLWVKAFVPDTPTNQERILLMQAGVVDKMSIGFDPDPSSIKYTSDARQIGKLTLYEVSAVDLPLNEATDVDGINALGLGNGRRIYVMGQRTIINPKRKFAVNTPLDAPFADLTTAWSGADALKRVSDFTKVTDTANADFDKCFIWVKDGSTAPSDRQMLIVDVTAGQDASGAVGTLSIIPAAIEEAANTVNDAIADATVLDPLGIPASELDNLKKTIDAYYAKMADTFSDPTLISPWDNGNTQNENEDDNELRNRKITEKFKGATLNSVNLQLLKTAADNINKVLASAQTSNDDMETHDNESDEAFAALDWSDTLSTFETLKGLSK